MSVLTLNSESLLPREDEAFFFQTVPTLPSEIGADFVLRYNRQTFVDPSRD